jgi:hypothetical protein
MGTVSSVSGGDAAYSALTITQYNSVGYGTSFTPIGNPLVRSGANGNSVTTGAIFSISQYGIGVYLNKSITSNVDTCDGRVFPPYDVGNTTGLSEATVFAEHPTASFEGNSGVIAVSQFYGPAWPGTIVVNSNPGFPSNIAMPQWVLSGPAAQQFQLSCTSCESTTIEAVNPAPISSCNSVLSLHYTIDGIASNTLSLLVMSANANVPSTSPTTGNTVDNTAVTTANTSGYKSYQYWNIEDNCGDNIDDLNALEAFPNGFTSLVTNNWPTPTPTSWTIGNGGWYDVIGEWTQANPPGLSPLPSPPQTPLSSEAIYQGTQQIWAGTPSSVNAEFNTLVKTQTQTHYIDHGLSH